MNQIIKTTVAEIGGEEQNYEGLVTFHNDDPVTTSLRFAEIFGECHDHVLQAIDKLKELEFHRLYFKPVIYSQEEGKSFKIYLISMDGFLVLSTAFPNKKHNMTSITKPSVQHTNQEIHLQDKYSAL